MTKEGYIEKMQAYVGQRAAVNSNNNHLQQHHVTSHNNKNNNNNNAVNNSIDVEDLDVKMNHTHVDDYDENDD